MVFFVILVKSPNMKKLLFSFLLFSAVFLISCTKHEHQIRFTNNYTETIRDIKVGDVSLNDVSPGSSSEYKVIPEGDFKITGQAANGFLEGSGSVSGKGT